MVNIAWWVVPAPLMIGLLTKAGSPTDCTLCDMVTEGSQVQVAVPFTATVPAAAIVSAPATQ